MPSKRAILYAGLVALAACSGIYLLLPKIYADSPEQKRKLSELVGYLNGDAGLQPAERDWQISALPGYSHLCRSSMPAIAQSDCIELAILGSSTDNSNRAAKRVEEFLLKNISSQRIRGLSGSMIVLTPIVRTDKYDGDVTAYSINKHFKVGAQLKLIVHY